MSVMSELAQVVSDYMDRMQSASGKLQTTLRTLLQHVLTRHPNTPSLSQTPYTLSAKEGLTPIVVFNTLGWARTDVLSVR